MNPDEAQLVAKVVDPNGNLVEQVLRIACYDEYRANAYYQKVIDTFGPVTPFTNIAQAEIRHYSMLENLCAKYGAQPPVNDWYDKTVIGATLLQCCRDGVDAEIANIQMYDHLLQFVNQPDIRDVFYREQAASHNNHLPAFVRCVESYSAQPAANPGSLDPQALNDVLRGIATGGNIDPTQLATMLGGLLNRDMLLGMAAGAALTMAVQSNLFQSHQDEKE